MPRDRLSNRGVSYSSSSFATCRLIADAATRNRSAAALIDPVRATSRKYRKAGWCIKGLAVLPFQQRSILIILIAASRYSWQVWNDSASSID
jgi:hypothetical protein